MWKKGTAIFVASLLAGGFVGWSASLKQSPLPPPVAKERPAPVVVPKPRWATADFIDHARKRAGLEKQPGHNPLSEMLADWTDEEIRAALDASLSDPDFVFDEYNPAGLLLGEWMKRDLAAAVAWFDQLESRSAQSRLALPLSHRWPADQAEQGFAYVRGHRELFPASSDWAILVKTLESRAAQGASAVEDLLKILREEKFEVGFLTPVRFPAGFDFARLAGSGEFQHLWDAGKAIRLLENMENPARRIEILETAFQPSGTENFGPDQEVSLRKKLAEWNASPARIEAIITRFKP